MVARRGVAAGSALSCCRGQRCRRRPVQVWKVCYIICSQLKNRKKKEGELQRACSRRAKRKIPTTATAACRCNNNIDCNLLPDALKKIYANTQKYLLYFGCRESGKQCWENSAGKAGNTSEAPQQGQTVL